MKLTAAQLDQIERMYRRERYWLELAEIAGGVGDGAKAAEYRAMTSAASAERARVVERALASAVRSRMRRAGAA